MLMAEQEPYALMVQPDDMLISPREVNDNFGTMVCFHPRYALGDHHNYIDKDDFLREMYLNTVGNNERGTERYERMVNMVWSRKMTGDHPDPRAVDDAMLRVISEKYVVMPLYLLDHSGLAMQTTSFNDPWDSGQVGWIYVSKEDALKEFEHDNQKLYESAWKSQFFSGMMMPIMQFVGNLGYVMVALLGGLFAIKGTIEVGDIQSFFQYIRNFTQPIQQIAQVTNLLQSSAAASERVFEFLEEPEEELQPENPDSIEGLEGNVQFEHVRFGYNPDKIIVNDFSADVHDGQKIAIVGPTGAGKTTIVKLLMRFYDVNGGSIKVDGHDIRNFNRSNLREMFGMVLQDTWLFSGTIMENIRYGRLDATDEEVIAAAKAAHIHNFIMQQPGGYQMVLDEETSNVSQGQKQLLTIARAILADNKILILDEATSSVDTRTEMQIQKAMDNLMKGRTSFVIAHRLSTIKDADVILVMKDGDIVEQGTHDELLAKNGFYADLYNSQFEQAS